MPTQYSEKFIESHRDINVNYDWWDAVYHDFSVICGILGIDLDRHEPSFSGFWSQGDGASWTGTYSARGPRRMTYDTAPAEIREHAPTDTELHRIADELCLLARVYGPVVATVTRRDRWNYVQSSTMTIDHWEFYDDERNENIPEEIVEHIDDTLITLFRDLAEWLYDTLETEHDYLTSDEAVAETLEANDITEETEEDEECSD
jgi:hypothetical protein